MRACAVRRINSLTPSENSMPAEPVAVPSNRFHREAQAKNKRSRTQARLMDAAVSLFAQRGVDATSVLEITTAAKVANGTFYNYFKDKEDITEAVYRAVTQTLVTNIIATLDRLDDGPEQIALGTIWFTEAVSSEPHWGWMMVKALEERTDFRAFSQGAIAKYIKNGLKQAHFSVQCTPALLALYTSVLSGAIRARLENPGAETRDIGLFAAEMHLRMLGMSPKQARAIPVRARAAHGDHPEWAALEIEPAVPRHAAVAGATAKGSRAR